ncbi:unnamed protein product [Rotaria sp. Silwood1]|nr:unnamed protein product [Rotaria sp. Silwood1]CAF0746311.1 unnamed protein product [Rotaria sp. Silwood1]CAF0802532.1 unnamed protein product [Rotaria sp. Silwood1]CAF3335368.1 unnamed protein product [Rotaria sp. Silwood1]CAF3356008.1 unnamed protein product [Rotaria sp. Silwood1]
MTVETDTIKNPKESPLKAKRKRASRSSSSGSSSSGTTSSSSASSRSSSSSSSNSSSSTSRSSSAASSPEKKNDRTSTKVINNKTSNKKTLEHGSIDDKKSTAPTVPIHRNASPSASRRQEKEKEATKIYIGKLSLNVTKEHLAEIFGTFGEIKDIDLPSHRIHPNLHRGFAHIEYVSPNGAEQACKYMETGQIDGQEIVCVLVHGQPAHLSADRNRRELSPYRRRRRSPLPPARHYPPPRRMGDRDRERERDRGRYNDRRSGYSPPSRNYRRGQSPPASSRRTGTSGNTAESPKKKERRYSRSSSSESK